MSLSDRLDELRQGVPGCTLVSFGELSTGLALRTSASKPYKHEYLEEILQQASLNFSLSDFMSAGNNLVVVATPDEVRIFVRSNEENTDIICCVCQSASEVPQVVQSAQQILTEMSRAA
ncbi:hypothetical protein [Roseovarius sp. 2305UL8-3]|uniref:hypothetical protein n=1 Tax=Roseovarius conchicola TaxID=3121636 RepID=UPI0035273635